MKKIVVLENNFLSTVTMRYALMNALTAYGFDVYVLSHGINDFEEQLKSVNVKKIEIGTSNTNPFEVIKYVKKEQAVLIPGSGVETGRFLPVKKGAHDKFVFLFIGRLVKIKGIEELITAAENILKDKNNCEFWIVGPLWKQNTGKLTFTEADVEEWKRKGIIYKGEAKDVRPFLGACDCFVLPSYREGLSNSLLEAASMEKPIVTTNVTGCRDVVVDGLNGFLCESENAVSLEQCLRKMLSVSEHERNEMGRQGRIKVKREYEKSLVIEKYIEQINKFA